MLCRLSLYLSVLLFFVFFFAVQLVRGGGDYESWSLLDLGIYLSDVFSYDPQTEKLDASQETDHAHHAGPSADGRTCQP